MGLPLPSSRTQTTAPGPVSKNNVRFVSKNPWYVLAIAQRIQHFPPCPTKPTHPALLNTHTQTLHTHCIATLSAPLSLYSSINLPPFLRLSLPLSPTPPLL